MSANIHPEILAGLGAVDAAPRVHVIPANSIFGRAILSALAEKVEQCTCVRCKRTAEVEELSRDAAWAEFLGSLPKADDLAREQPEPLAVSAEALATIGVDVGDEPSQVRAIGAALLTHLNASSLSHGEKRVYTQNIVMATQAIHAIQSGQ